VCTLKSIFISRGTLKLVIVSTLKRAKMIRSLHDPQPSKGWSINPAGKPRERG
jgi:hypothetical protein